MPESFEIVDPLERFVDAREEAVSAGIEIARQGRQIRPNQAWLAGAAVFAISTLILVDALSPRIGGELASGVNNQSASDTAPQHHVSSRQPGSDPPALPASPPRAQSVHAIDPKASAAQSSESQVQTSQKPAPLSSVTSGQQAAAVESSTSAQLKDRSPATAEVTEAPSHPGLGDQLLKITSAVRIRNGPSASADIIGMAYAGTMARVASRDSGWTQIVDPSSGKTGWIDSTVLSPLTRTVDAASTEDSTPKQMSEDEPAEALNKPALEQGFKIPDKKNALPAAKAKKNSSNRHYGRRGFPFSFVLRLFRR
jgi:SH3-like domain-containing protein